MPSFADTQAPLEELLDRLVLSAKQSAKSRTFELEPLISSICQATYDNGLSTEQLATVLDIITAQNRLDQSTITKLLHNLYPAERVPTRLVHQVVSSLGQSQGRPSNATQTLLLQWLLAIKDVLEEDSSLVNCYGAMFSHIQTLATRPMLCHLLGAVTRRKHVKPWRIHVLLELARDAATEAGVLALLQVYRDFHPEIVIDHPGSRRRGGGFKLVDQEWIEHLRYLQARTAGGNDPSVAKASSFRVIRRGFKRTRAEVVPALHSLRIDASNIVLEEVDGAKDLVDRLDLIDPPSQIIAALDDPLLQKYMLLMHKHELQRRFDGWLALYLDGQAAAAASQHASTDRGLGEVLHKALQYTQRTKTLPSPITAYLRTALPEWDGKQHRSAILHLISRLSEEVNFEDLQSSILAPLEDAVLSDSSASSLCDLLSCYTQTLRNWTARRLSDAQRSGPATSSTNIQALASHASLLADQILCTDPLPHHCTAVLEHLAATAHLASLSPERPGLRILTPSASTVYQLAFTYPSPAILSPLCGHLATFKRSFEAFQRAAASAGSGSGAGAAAPQQYTREHLGQFNGFLMDACNLLWRGRAFNATDPNALACLLDPAVVASLSEYVAASAAEGGGSGRTLSAAFLICQHPALVAIATRVLRDLGTTQLSSQINRDEWRGRELGSIDQRKLAELERANGVRVSWQEFRLEVLRWLEAHGLPGVGELMFSTMKILLDRQRRESGTV